MLKHRWVHEAYYKSLRESRGAKDSRSAREFVGRLFSTAYYAAPDLASDTYVRCEGAFDGLIFVRVGNRYRSYFVPMALSSDSILSEVSILSPEFEQLLEFTDRSLTSAEWQDALDLINHCGSEDKIHECFFQISYEKPLGIRSAGRYFAPRNYSFAALGSSPEKGLMMTTGAQSMYTPSYQYDRYTPYERKQVLFYYTRKLFSWHDSYKELFPTGNEPLCKRHSTREASLPWMD